MDDEKVRALGPIECRALLRRGGIGRVGVSVGALPAILPVCFAMLDLDIVFRAPPGTALSSTVANSVVAFQTDSLADASSDAWSVLVVGLAEVVDEPKQIASAHRLLCSIWPSDDCPEFARLPSDVISGHSYGRQ